MNRYLRVGGMVVALTALLMWSGGPAAGDRLGVTTESDRAVGRRLVVAGVAGRTDEIAGATEQEEIAEAAAAPLAMFVVDRTDDDAGATGCTAMPNDCSLRGAIIAANTAMGADTIILQSGATYTLSLDATAADEDTAAEDDLDITSEITIQGNGATIRRDPNLGCNLNNSDAAGEFRIFEVHSGGNLTLQNVTVTNGCADGSFPDGDGGGIRNASGGTVTIQSSTLSGNSADDAGGGILNSGKMTITDSTISGNSASGGGGIYNDIGDTMTITNSTISNNGADFGGGIRNLGTVTLTNSTLSGNSASNSGGGIYNERGGTVTIQSSTISNNSAGDDGGGIYNFIGTVNIKNSIVGNNTAGNCFGTLAATGTNLATDGSCGMGFTTVPSTGAGGLNLGPLANNGGPTQTHALLTGSVAVDAVSDCTDLGSNPVTQDQRGVMRPIDGDGDGTSRCDVGAYEAPVCTNDNVPPTITTCPGALTVGTNVGCTYVGGIGTATATDNCDPLVTISNNAPAAFPLGMTTVTWKATDDAGNMSTCMQTVTVVDDDAPQITCPGNITVGTAAPNCTAPVSYTPTATDNCPVSVTCTPPSGSTFALGTTTVNCKATDGAGNMATCTFTVTVVDDDAPQITCPPNQTVQAGANCQATVSVGTATATDNCTASGSITITGTRSDGQMLTAPYPGPSGVGSQVTTITWKATDAAGNMATCMQTITVTNAAPTANAGPDQTVDEGASVTLGGTGTDPNPGQTLTFQWTQTGGPAVVINNANMATATFTAPEVGTLECVALTFQLKVTDPCGAMATDTVVVRVRDTLVLQDDADPTKCVVIRRDCGPTANGTYCMKVGGMTLTGPLTVSLQGNTVNAQSTAADPNVAQGIIDLGRCRGNFRLTISRNNPTVTHTIVSNVNACNDVCMCP